MTSIGSSRPLNAHRPALDVPDSIDLSRQVRDLPCRQHLPRLGEAAQTRREVQRTAAEATVDQNRLSRIEANPDCER